MSEFRSTTYPVARKWYFCDGCENTIFTGTRHVKTVGNVDDRFRTSRYCNRCVEPVSPEDKRDRLDREIAAWNERHPIGTLVRFWTGAREGEGRTGNTRSEAEAPSGYGVVWVTGEPSCIALSHVEVIEGQE